MYSEVHDTLTDPDHDWGSRLLRLQGWRGDQLRQAAASGNAARLAPAFCAAGSLAAGALASPALAAVLAASALIGALGSNHPVEIAGNAVAARRGGATLPANRAAKRLGCVLGVVFLGAASVAFTTGHDGLGRVLAGAMGVTAAFVAITNICVPSVIFTLLWGSERAQAPTLAAAVRGPETTPGLAPRRRQELAR